MKFKKKYYREQVDENDCGVACLAMMLENYGVYYSLASLRQLAKTTQEGTTALGLVETAEQLGFEVQAIQADMSLFEQADIPYPFIAHVIKQGQLLHYYVVTGCDQDAVHIADPDPSVGLATLSTEQFAKEWTGITLLMQPGEAFNQQTGEQKHHLTTFMPVLLKHKGLIATIVGITLVVTLINILGSYYLQLIIDRYIPNQMLGLLGTLSLGLVIAYLMQQWLAFIQSQLLVRFGQHLSVDVLLSYLHHVLQLPMSFFATRKTGEIVSRFNDASTIIDALASAVLSVFLDVSMAVIVAIILFIQQPLLFGISFLALPLYGVIVFGFMKPFSRLNHQAMESNAKLSSVVIDDLTGIESIKSLASETRNYQKIKANFERTLSTNRRYFTIENVQTSLKTLLHLILNVMILWLGSRFIIRGALSVGQLLAFNALLVYFTNPLENIINLQTKWQKAQVANDRLSEVYRVESEFADEEEQQVANATFNQQLTLDHVHFSFGYSEDIVSDISLTVPKGGKIALVGESGSGKTTLAKLIVRFYEPEEGEYRIDNILATQHTKHQVRRLIHYVPQEPYVFSGTILENLTLGIEREVDESDIWQALRNVELLATIQQLPLGLETPLSSNGSELSGGQKQRLVLARALLTQAPILILDESTSHLDVLTERRIIDHLFAMDRTLIFIAHRLSIAARCDCVYVMANGHIVQQGTPDELAKQSGLYQQLISQ